MNLSPLAYYGPPMLFLVALVVFGCIWILHISARGPTGMGVALILLAG